MQCVCIKKQAFRLILVFLDVCVVYIYMKCILMTGKIENYEADEWVLFKTNSSVYWLQSTDSSVNLPLVNKDDPLVSRVAQLNNIEGSAYFIVLGGRPGKFLEVSGEIFIELSGNKIIQKNFPVQKKKWSSLEV